MKSLPKTAWMINAAMLGLWSASQPRTVRAQAANGTLPTLPAPATAPAQSTGQSRIDNTVVSPPYSIKFKDTNVTEIFKMLGESSHTHIIVSDDVTARLPYINIVDLPLSTILQRIAAIAHLAVGKVGTDTYLIVNAPGTAMTVPLHIVPPHYDPMQPSVPHNAPTFDYMPGLVPKAGPHPSWSPRTFNGMTYYMVPLGQGTTVTTAPRLAPVAPRLQLSNPGAIDPAK